MIQAAPADPLDYALQYAAHDWRVVPVYGTNEQGICNCAQGSNCTSPGKHPRIDAWQHEASSDPAKLRNWFSFGNTNLGVKLGRDSGIIDIECDSDEAEQQLQDLFGGQVPVVPTFQSKRGKHRLFKWRPGFPDNATKAIGKIDLKLGNKGLGSQSVFPPSRRGEISYDWLVTPDEAEPGEIPDEVLARMLAAMEKPKATPATTGNLST